VGEAFFPKVSPYATSLNSCMGMLELRMVVAVDKTRKFSDSDVRSREGVRPSESEERSLAASVDILVLLVLQVLQVLDDEEDDDGLLFLVVV